jgi:hypothetical protein
MVEKDGCEDEEEWMRNGLTGYWYQVEGKKRKRETSLPPFLTSQARKRKETQDDKINT